MKFLILKQFDWSSIELFLLCWFRASPVLFQRTLTLVIFTKRLFLPISFSFSVNFPAILVFMNVKSLSQSSARKTVTNINFVFANCLLFLFSKSLTMNKIRRHFVNICNALDQADYRPFQQVIAFFAILAKIAQGLDYVKSLTITKAFNGIVRARSFVIFRSYIRRSVNK